MPPGVRLFLLLGSLLALVAVVVGAFGAHGIYPGLGAFAWTVVGAD